MDKRTHFTVRNAVVIPLAWSLILGTFTGLLAGLVISVSGKPNPGAWGALVGVGVAALSWLESMRRWSRVADSLLDVLPETAPADYETMPTSTRLIISNETGTAGQIADLPVSEAEIIRIARAIAGGTPFTERALSGPYKPFTQNRLREIRGALLDRGLLIEKSPGRPKNGYTWTRGGQAMISYYSAMASPAVRRLPAETSMRPFGDRKQAATQQEKRMQ